MHDVLESGSADRSAGPLAQREAGDHHSGWWCPKGLGRLCFGSAEQAERRCAHIDVDLSQTIPSCLWRTDWTVFAWPGLPRPFRPPRPHPSYCIGHPAPLRNTTRAPTLRQSGLQNSDDWRLAGWRCSQKYTYYYITAVCLSSNSRGRDVTRATV